MLSIVVQEITNSYDLFFFNYFFYNYLLVIMSLLDTLSTCFQVKWIHSLLGSLQAKVKSL